MGLHASLARLQCLRYGLRADAEVGKDAVARDHRESSRARSGATNRWVISTRSRQARAGEIVGCGLVVESQRVQGLVSQYRQVLRDGVAEQRSEDTDVKAPAVSQANHRLGVNLVSDSDAGSEKLPVGGGATVVADDAVTGNTNHAFLQHREATIA